ncbi:MAG: class I SAM-dependent methyltransferase [Acidimicrobiia bacterium]
MARPQEASAPRHHRDHGGLARLVERLLGRDAPIAISCYDGSTAGRPDATVRLVVRSPDAVRRVLTAPGELGFGRAYVAGDIDVEGDLFEALAVGTAARPHLGALELVELLRFVGDGVVHRLPPPPEEIRLRGRRHSPERDAAAIAHHYDVSNAFYRMVLGPSMTYSCAVWPDGAGDATLEEAQAAKYELVCRKLGLRPGMRLLDVGCGWGGMVRHAARHHGVSAVGITLSARQAEWAERAVAEDGLGDRVEIRVQDYRHVTDGPFDAVSSIGMFEHVGLARLGEYFTTLHGLLRPGGRLLNHGISRPFGGEPRLHRRGFVDRYVFPDGELHEIGAVVSKVQEVGFEARHLESLREHYGLTLRAWVANLERNWSDAVAEVGNGRARVWRLYMAGCALGFESGRTQVHQLLAVKPDGGRSGLPLRPAFEG